MSVSATQNRQQVVLKKKKSLERMLILIGSLLSSVYVANKFKHCIKIQCLSDYKQMASLLQQSLRLHL